MNRARLFWMVPSNRGNRHKLGHRKHHRSTRKRFTMRMTDYWNKLPKRVVVYPSFIFNTYPCNLL